MMLHWARYSGGMLGRSPDYLNVSLMASAAAAEFYGTERSPLRAENVRTYYEYVREHDLCLTHTLVNPQANRALTSSGHPSAAVAARIVKETDRGMVIQGARILATLGPLSDEIAVFPSTVLKAAADTTPFRLRLCNSLGYPRPEICVSRGVRLRRVTRRASPWLALRRDGCDRDL